MKGRVTLPNCSAGVKRPGVTDGLKVMKARARASTSDAVSTG